MSAAHAWVPRVVSAEGSSRPLPDSPLTWARAPEEALRDLRPTLNNVVTVLERLIGPDRREAAIQTRQIVRRLAISDATVRRAIKELADLGWITRRMVDGVRLIGLTYPIARRKVEEQKKESSYVGAQSDRRSAQSDRRSAQVERPLLRMIEEKEKASSERPPATAADGSIEPPPPRASGPGTGTPPPPNPPPPLRAVGEEAEPPRAAASNAGEHSGPARRSVYPQGVPGPGSAARGDLEAARRIRRELYDRGIVMRLNPDGERFVVAPLSAVTLSERQRLRSLRAALLDLLVSREAINPLTLGNPT